MVVVTLVSIGLTTIILYETSIDQKRESLVLTAKSQARLMEAVARFNSQSDVADHPQGSKAATISQIVEANKQYEGVGRTDEFTLAFREGDQIVFVLSHRLDDTDKPQPIPFNGISAEPMRRALLGQSGTIIGLDYRNEMVLAAFEPVAVLNLGIVAKVDIQEIREPFISAIVTVAITSLLLIMAGTFLFYRISNPLIEKIIKEKERTENYLDLAEAIIVTLDAAGIISQINQRGCNVLGYKKDELVGVNFFDLVFSKEQKEKQKYAFTHVISDNSGHVKHFENELLTREGGIRTVAWHSTPVMDKSGNILGSLSSGQDITERKNAELKLSEREERYRFFIENIDEGVLVVENGKIVDASVVWLDLFRVDIENSLGRSPLEFVAPHEIDRVKQIIADGLTTSYESELVRGDGTTFVALLRGRNLVFAGRNVRLATVMDITKRKEVELALEMAMKESEKANQAKTEFLSSMSHELRTPLNAIIGFSDSIKTEIFGPLGNSRYKEYLDDIHESGQHLLALINDILDVSAFEAGALELNEENFTLEDVVDASILLIRPQAEKGRVTVTSSINSEAQRVYGDNRRIKQVLINLLSNAVKYTPEGGDVSVRAILNEDGSLALEVTDTGIGMNEEEIETALSKFGQVESGLNRIHTGTGLGLPLTKGFMEMHEGSLEIRSQKGQGTIITVTFPKERVVKNVC